MQPSSNGYNNRYEQLDKAGTLEVASEPALVSPSTSTVVTEADPHAPRGPRTLLHLNRWAIMATAGVAVVVVAAGMITLGLAGFRANKQEDQNASKQPANNYAVKDLSLDSSVSDQLLNVTQANKLSINGELQVGNTFVLTPTATPSTPKVGQMYYDRSTNTPYVYNGSTFISLFDAPSVLSIGGTSGDVSLGTGLQIAGGQLSLSPAAQQSLGVKVTTLQGLSGDVTLLGGAGIAINGTTISNTGVTGLQGTANQIIVSGSNGAVQLSLPQSIATTSSPTFASLLLVGALSVNTIQQTAGGNDVVVTAGSDDVVFTSGGRTFRFPTVGGANQVICTTDSACAAGGGSYVVMQPGSAQTDSGALSSIWINNTGGGNLLQLQANGADTFVVANNGHVTIAGTLTAGNITAGTYNGATISGGTLSGGSFSGGTVSGGTLTAAAVNSLSVSGTAVTGTGALTVSAGGTNQNLVLQGSGTGAVVITNPILHNLAGATYTFDPSDTASVTAAICTTQGNCVGANGGAVSSAGSTGGIPVFGIDGYHLSNSILSQISTTTLSISGSTIQGTGSLTLTAGGTNQNLTLQGTGTGTVIVKNPSFNNANGATYIFNAADGSGVNATICTTQGNCTGASGGGVVSTGTTNSLAVFGSDGYHLANSIITQDVGATTATVTGALAVTGSINGATISGGNLSGGTFNGATITGGTLTAAAVNGLNVSGTAITGTNDLTISAGGTNQNLTLQGSGSGVVAVNGNFTATGTINGATISGGNLSGGTINGATITGGTLTAAAVNGLNVSGTSVSGTGALSISAGGTNQNLTLQGSGTGLVAVTGNLTTTGTINGATISGGTLSGGTVSGGTLTSSAVNGLNVSGTAITGTAALTVSAGGTNQNLILQGSGSGIVVIQSPSFNNANGATYTFDATDGSGVNATICTTAGNCSGGATVTSTGTSNSVALYGSDGNHLVDSIISQDVGATTVTVAGNLVATGTVNGATISGGTISGGTLSGGTVSGGTLTSSAVNGLDVSGTAVTGTGALTVSAGGTNQDLTLQGSGTGTVIIQAPTFHNANGATYTFNAGDGIGVTATICTTQGNCTGASGGGVVSNGVQYSIAMYGTDGYHLENSILAQDAGGTTLTVSGTTIAGTGALTVSAGGTNQDLTLQGSGTGVVVVKNPSFNNANGATYTFNASDAVSVNATICTTEGNCTGSSGGGVVSTGTGTSVHIPLFTTDGYHFGNSIITQDAGATAASVAGDFTASGTINGATISGGTVSGGTLSGGTVSGGTLTSSAVNNLNVSGTAITGTGALTISAGGTNQNLNLQGSGTGIVAVTGALTAGGTINGATISGGTLSGGTVSGGTLTASAVNNLSVSGTAITGTGALTVSAGGTNQNLTLQGTGTGSVIVKNPSFNNANGATYTFNAADGSGVTASICTTQGNCTGASGGGVVSSGSPNSIAFFTTDGYHFGNSIISQDVGATTATVAGDFTASGTINGATISAGTLSGGTVSGGTLTASAVNNLSVSGTAVTGTGALTISAGGTNQNLTLQGTGTGVVAVTGNLTVGGTINSATISGGTVSGGTLSGGTVSGGTLTASAVNSLNVSGTAVTGTGALSISAGGTNQNLTLQGTGTGVVAVTGNFTASGTINGATISAGTLSGGTLSGGTVSGGTLTASAVNSLSVSGSAVTGTGALTVSAGGTNQNLTVQGSGTGVVIVKNPSFNNANGATYTFNAADGIGVNTTICTMQSGCTGSMTNSGSQYTIPMFGATAYQLSGSILSQDAGGTTLTVTGSTITGNGALSLTAGGTNQSLTLQGSGTGAINIGTANAAAPINIGNTTNAISQVIKIGANATASSTNTVTIGNLLSTSTTTIQGGTGAGAVSIQSGTSGTILIGTASVATVTVGNASGTVTLNGTVNAVSGLSVNSLNVITSGRQLANLTIPTSSTVLYGSANAFGIPYVNSSNVLQFANINGTYSSTTKCLMSDGTTGLGFGTCPGGGGSGWSLTGSDTAGSVLGVNTATTADFVISSRPNNVGATSSGASYISFSGQQFSVPNLITISANANSNSAQGGGAHDTSKDYFRIQNSSGTIAMAVQGSSTPQVFMYLASGGGVGVNSRVCSQLTANTAGLTTLATCTNTGTDLAESYNSTQSLAVGEIVAVDPNNYPNVVRSSEPSQSNLMGIVSTDPDYVMGEGKTPDGYPIALNGRVPTKVNGEGGAIHAGDKITSSSVPGVGKKATGAGMVVGTALTDFDGSGQGTIEVFVHVFYYEPSPTDTLQAQTASLGDLNVSGAATINNLTVTGLATVHDLAVGGHIITTGGQPTDELQAAAGVGATVDIDGTDVTGTITITTGDTPISGEMARIIFSELYTAAPHVVISPSNAAAAHMSYFKGSTTVDSFMINFDELPTAHTVYTFDYFISQ